MIRTALIAGLAVAVVRVVGRAIRRDDTFATASMAEWHSAFSKARRFMNWPGFFSAPSRTGRQARLADVRLLAPVEPKKVIAVGLNYKSHLGTREPAAYPGLFAKYPTSIVGPGAAIVIPADAKNVHYEGEIVVVIGRRASHVTEADAPQYVFGVTAGNDVSERDWQSADLQWFRAKATDTSVPSAPSS